MRLQNMLIDTGWSKFGASALVGLLGFLPQILWIPAIQAQSIVEQRLCGDGVLTNNCQNFVARTREESWKRIFLGTWEFQNEANNRWQMLVTWNSQASRYEGILTKQGQLSQSVGFSINELVWTATLSPDLNHMNVQQKLRSGSNGISTGFVWRADTIDLDRSTFETMMYTTGLAAIRVH